jgi:hypothetical protein
MFLEKALCELVFCTRKRSDSGELVVCLGLGSVCIALVVSPLALVGRLLEVLPDLALVHCVDESSLELCDKDDLLDQASLDLLLNVVDPREQISGELSQMRMVQTHWSAERGGSGSMRGIISLSAWGSAMKVCSWWALWARILGPSGSCF